MPREEPVVVGDVQGMETIRDKFSFLALSPEESWVIFRL
jgi:hypothetical protein